MTRYLLTGLAFCGLCSGKLVARPRSDGKRCYVCASGPGFGGCGKIRVVADPIEDFVVAAVMRRLDGVDLSPVVAADDVEVVAEIGTLEARLADLAETFAAGDVSRAEWVAARNGISRRLDAARALLAERTSVSASVALRGNLDGLAARWPDLDIGQRRAVLDLIVDRITVDPVKLRGSNKFDHERVDIKWIA